MKLTLKRSDQGSTLIITIVTCVLIGTVLMSYLKLITHRNTEAMRAMAWNGAIPVLEAGIEEALTHLHDDSTAPSANEWIPVEGISAFLKERQLPDGTRFSVTISNFTSASPVIYSVGHVRSPLHPDQFITRSVKVTTTNPPSVFTHAIASNGKIKMSGDAVVDGYDSSKGPYDPAKNRSATGSVATNSKESKAIDVGSAHLYGRAVTGPGGTVSVTSGTVGDFDWSAANPGGSQEGWVNDNMNVQYQPNVAPSGTVPAPPPVSIGGSNVTRLTSGSWSMASFLSFDKKKPLIISGKDVTLWVTGDFSVGGEGYVYIEPGASLKLYVGSEDSTTLSKANVSGGGIVNGTGDPNSFEYFGLPSNIMLNYSGKADFVGTINAPQADFKLSGNSSVYGAIICNTFNSNGKSNVHYDEHLGQQGIFLVTSWREL